MTQINYSSVKAWDRYLALVDQPDGPEGCWYWVGAVTSQGYPKILIRGRAVLVRRFVWCSRQGLESIEPGYDVLITCGNDLCVKFEHLVCQRRMRLARRNKIRAHQSIVHDDRMGGSLKMMEQALAHIAKFRRLGIIGKDEVAIHVQMAVDKVREILDLPQRQLTDEEMQELLGKIQNA